MKIQNPPNNGEQAFYQVDCDRKQWTIELRNYVEKVDDSICVFNVRTSGTGNQFLGNFGETFAKDKYIIFDWQKLAVGIADIQWENFIGYRPKTAGFR